MNRKCTAALNKTITNICQNTAEVRGAVPPIFVLLNLSSVNLAFYCLDFWNTDAGLTFLDLMPSCYLKYFSSILCILIYFYFLLIYFVFDHVRIKTLFPYWPARVFLKLTRSKFTLATPHGASEPPSDTDLGFGYPQGLPKVIWADLVQPFRRRKGAYMNIWTMETCNGTNLEVSLGWTGRTLFKFSKAFANSWVLNCKREHYWWARLNLILSNLKIW